MCFEFLKRNMNQAPVIPITDLVEITRAEFLVTLEGYGIMPIASDTPLDFSLFLAKKAELDRIALYLVYPADLYIDGIADCEDYGLQAQCDSAFKYHCNGVRLALGSTPLGYHGWAMALDQDKLLWQLEPNNGFPYAATWFAYGENEYIPEKVLA